jgi:hypothetical protein
MRKRRDFFDCLVIPSALIISVVTSPAPNFLIMSLKGRLVMPAIGAMMRLFSRAMDPILSIPSF